MSNQELKDAIEMFSIVQGNDKYRHYLSKIIKHFGKIDELYLHLWLPKFQIETELRDELKIVLENLGIKTISNRNNGNNSLNHLLIDQIVHKTFLSVDEKGIEAAVVTSGNLVKSGLRVSDPDIKNIPFRVDYPFYVSIVMSEKINDDKALNRVLFVGKINTV